MSTVVSDAVRADTWECEACGTTLSARWDYCPICTCQSPEGFGLYDYVGGPLLAIAGTAVFGAMFFGMAWAVDFIKGVIQ